MSSTSIVLVINNFVDDEFLRGSPVFVLIFSSLVTVLRIFLVIAVSRILVVWLPIILRVVFIQSRLIGSYFLVVVFYFFFTVAGGDVINVGILAFLLRAFAQLDWLK